MDADTRHQLKQNELAETLAKLKTLGDTRTRLTVLAIVVMLLAWVGYRFWRTSQESTLLQNWEQLTALDIYSAAGGAAPLEQLRALIAGDTHPGLVAAARLRLAQGLAQQAHREPERSDALLSEAVDVLAQAREAPGAPASLQAAATYSLASVYESLREFEHARGAYQAVVDDPRSEGSPLKEMASERLDNMDELSARIDFEPGDPPPPATQPSTAPAPVSAPAETAVDAEQP